MTWQPALDEIERRSQFAPGSGGEQPVARHHGERKFTVREPIDRVPGTGTFEEPGVLHGQPRLATERGPGYRGMRP